MTDINPPRINRRRMLSITATTVAGLAAGALASSGPAHAAPSLCDLPGTGSVGPELCGTPSPPPECGDPSDTGTARLELWDDVKGATPANPKGAEEVVETFQPVEPFTNPLTYQGFAIRKGNQGTLRSNNLLLIPTQRITGIECRIIWQPTTINFPAYAYEKAEAYQQGKVPAGSAVAVGINSVAARQKDQLHIHMSRLQTQANSELATEEGKGTKSNIAWTLDKWKHSRVELLGRTYRIVHVPDLRDVFENLRVHVATGNMREQMLVITARPSGGYYLINSEVSALKGGTGQCDLLLDYS